MLGLLPGSIVPALVGAAHATSPPTGAGAPTSADTAAGVVSLIPSSSSFVVSGTPQNPEPPPVATGNAFVYPDLYNAASGQGNASLAETRPGYGLTTSIEFSNVSGRSPGVVGYPELQYGKKPWCATRLCASPVTDPRLSLPEIVRALPEITSVANYSVVSGTGPSTGTFDLAYDLWMTRSPNATSASAGDLELMVWLDHNGASILPGTPLTTLLLPTLWSGRWTVLPWQVYVQSALPRNDSGHWTVTYFVLDSPATVATIGVDLTGMVRSADAVLADWYPASWAPPGRAGGSASSALYLDDIELGSEFRPIASSGPVRFAWTLSNYCLRVSASTQGSVPPALGANCSVLPSPAPPTAGIAWGPIVTIGIPAAGATAGVGVALGRRPLSPRRSPHR